MSDNMMSTFSNIISFNPLKCHPLNSLTMSFIVNLTFNPILSGYY